MAAGQRPTRSKGLTNLLGYIARHGRWCLVLGLLGGLLLPGLAQTLKPYLPELIALLLFVSALRIGPKAAWGELGDMRKTVGLALIYQLAAPLAALAVLALIGLANTPVGLVIVLVLAAPSVTGAPNFTIMMNKDPAPPMRLLLVGTALFPVTVIPVLLALPAIPTLSGVLEGALRLLLVIALAVGAAFTLRRGRDLSNETRSALDGTAAILLGIVVIGLMSAVNPTLRDAPQTLLLWLGFALLLNFGLQLAAHQLLSRGGKDQTGLAIISGNRNIALFLVALPEDIVAQILIFIGCYQVPMYLTPIIMRRWLTTNR